MAIIKSKAYARKPGEPADRHNIQVKLNDEDWARFEADVEVASKGPGGRVTNGGYAKNAILEHHELYCFRQSVLDIIRSSEENSDKLAQLETLVI